jgi:DNA-binding NarL/FixJ family response regulator
MRVSVLEDQLLTREGLIRSLTEQGVHVVAAVGEVDALLASIDRDAPDAVVLDVRLPPTFTDEGLRVAADIRATHPEIAVLVLSQYVELEFVEPLLDGTAESIGYLLKDRLLDPTTLTDALVRVVAGECVIDPGVVRALLDARRASDPLESLTERELDVLACIAEGLTNTGIAARLYITDRTVEVHAQHIFEKLGLGETPHANRRVLAVLTYLKARAA